jgi:BioD-like phosphotransacetylase family protein
MIALYVSSTAPYSGKSAMCVGLGRHFQEDGYRIGYMRPLTTTKTCIAECVIDKEAELMIQTLELKDRVSAMWPVCLDPPTVEAVMRGEGLDYRQVIKDAFAQIAENKDIVLCEGGSRCVQGLGAGISCQEISAILRARVLVVGKYDVATTLVVDDLLAYKMRLGGKMLGAVLNAVPRHRMDFVEKLVVPFLEQRGVPVYAVLPLDRVFSSVSIGELAEVLRGEIICRADLAGNLVENLMVGAMSVDSALQYFRRKLNLGVITGGDRPDIQLAALETSTKVLILTGNMQPSPLILSRAEEAGVAVVMVKHDTMTTVQRAEEAFAKTRFHQPKKIQRFEHMLNERFDFGRFYRDLNLQQA